MFRKGLVFLLVVFFIETPIPHVMAQQLLFDEKSLKDAQFAQKEAEKGRSSAQFMLGQYYYSGYGVNEDAEKAAFWTEKAAVQGHVNAQYWTGNIYYYGIDVSKDEVKGLDWIEKAAEQGDKDAQQALKEITSK